MNDVADQAERDVKCPVALAAYPCMERYLISSWRELFASKFAFVGTLPLLILTLQMQAFLAVCVQNRRLTNRVKRRRPLYRRTVGWIYGGDGERHRALPLIDCDERRSL